MKALLIKTYRYAPVASDVRFTYEAAFFRLKAVLELLRSECGFAEIIIAVPFEELEQTAHHVELRKTERLIPSTGIASHLDVNSSEPLLVIDEQAFYASCALIKAVSGLAAGGTACWIDTERVLWGFNYHESCHFFLAPPRLVAKHCDILKVCSFFEFQGVILKESPPKAYTISSSDIPEIYARAAKWNPYPYHYYIEPTSRCNSKCIMCPFHSPDPEIAKGRLYLGDGGEDMPVSLFKSLVDQVSAIPWTYLPHYRGTQITAQLRGEPLLAHGIRDMLAHVKAQGLRLSFSTNGSTLHQNGLAEFLVDIGTDEVIVSIDGNEREYARIRPQLNYKQVVANIKLLGQLRAENGLSTPVLYTKRVHLRGSTTESDMHYIKEFAPLVDWAGMAHENYDDFITEGKGFSEYFFEVPDEKRLPCLWATDVSVVKSNGMVDLCFGAAEHYIGDVNSRPLLEILDTAPLRQKALNAHAAGRYDEISFCRSCTSWKAGYSRHFMEGEYEVSMNPVLAYWKHCPEISVANKASYFSRLLAKIGMTRCSS